MNFFNLYVLILLELSVTSKCLAVPILNENAASDGTIATIYKDSRDPNQYYLLPVYVEPCVDYPSHELIGSFVTVNDGFLQRGALVNLSICPQFNGGGTDKAIQSIRKINPKANFSVIPLQEAEITFDQDLLKEVESNNCNELGAVFGSLSTCSFKVSPRGRRYLLRYQDNLVLPIFFTYSVSGIRAGANANDSQLEVLKFSIPYRNDNFVSSGESVL